MPRRHFTEDSAASCWLCSPDRSEPCHVHDPAMRRYLALKGDGAYYETDEERGDVAWTLPAKTNPE